MIPKTRMQKTRVKNSCPYTPKWHCIEGKEIICREKFGILGILNITPDSFYDGGKYNDRKSALARARLLLEEGSEIVDMGAESTRPGAVDVAPEKELAQLLPVLTAFKREFPQAIVSIDTRNSATAAETLKNGAAIINDVSACEHDPGLVDVLAQFKPGYILMHSQGKPAYMQNNPHYNNVVDEVKSFFENKLNALVKAGLPENNIALDPGIGFGKNISHNLDLLTHIEEFAFLGRPLVGAVSQKSMFNQILGHPPDKHGMDTAVASALLWSKGVAWHRVHNVAQTRNALRIATAISCLNL